MKTYFQLHCNLGERDILSPFFGLKITWIYLVKKIIDLVCWRCNCNVTPWFDKMMWQLKSPRHTKESRRLSCLSWEKKGKIKIAVFLTVKIIMKPILPFNIVINLSIITKINNIANTLKESYLRLNLLRTEETNTFSSIVANLWASRHHYHYHAICPFYCW